MYDDIINLPVETDQSNSMREPIIKMDHYDCIQKSIDYIEENLENSISIEELASQAFFSPFYFHRIFHAAAGIPLMEYIRRRRLSRAAGDLSRPQMKIADTALKYGFASHDSFLRAFKKYYGLTPGEFRKNRLEREFVKKVDIKEDECMYDLSFGQRVQCDEEARKECLQIIDYIYKMSKKATKSGLLSLEEEAGCCIWFLMGKGLRLMLDGTQPEILRRILERYIISSDLRGKELLSSCIIMEGILSIQAGVHPMLIREMLAAFLGVGFAQEADRYFLVDEDAEKGEVQEFLNKVKNSVPINSATSVLEEPLKKMDDRSLQRALREFDICDLVNALKGSGGETVIRVFNHLPQYTKSLLKDEMEAAGQVSTAQIVDAQNKIMGIIKKLRADGDII